MTTLADVALAKVTVLDSTMAYREAGNANSPTALFLHGNPTSSYIWRNIIPLVAPIAHCIAPDLIGFGQSGKPDIEYRFADHVRYLDAFLANAGISLAFVIAHDWGTALGFHLAARRPEFIRGLAFYGVPPAIAYLGGFSCDCTRNLPEGQDAWRERKDDSRRQCIRGGSSSLGDR